MINMFLRNKKCRFGIENFGTHDHHFYGICCLYCFLNGCPHVCSDSPWIKTSLAALVLVLSMKAEITGSEWFTRPHCISDKASDMSFHSQHQDKSRATIKGSHRMKSKKFCLLHIAGDQPCHTPDKVLQWCLFPHHQSWLVCAQYYPWKSWLFATFFSLRFAAAFFAPALRFSAIWCNV